MPIDQSAPHLPRSASIDAYGKGGFAFAGMSHRGSLLCLPDAIWAWPVARPQDIDRAALERVFAAASSIDTLIVGSGTEVWLAPAQMKKNRPGTVLHVLAEPAARDALAAIVLRETSAIGLRFHAVDRLVLPREHTTVGTEYGAVAIKIAYAPDGTANIAPEYDDCRRIAEHYPYAGQPQWGAPR